MKILKNQTFKLLLRRLSLSVGALAIAQLSLFANPSFAAPNNLTLSVYPVDSGANFPICPTEVTLTQTPRPYYEGGYTIDGTASLGWFARPFKIEKSDKFSVTWVAKLQIKYHNCQATARITKILDMTGLNDANSLTPVILKKDVKDGNPVWTWGGTD